MTRGANPKSLANLKAPWTKETAPPHPSTGPKITPALHRMAGLTPPEFMHLPLDRMTVAENIAWVRLYSATQFAGAADAVWVADRLDGRAKSLDEQPDPNTMWLEIQRQVVTEVTRLRVHDPST